jgi:arylsulfatase A-like enzyme
VVTSLDGFLGEKMTRRTALATVIGTAALVATEYVLTKSAPTVTAALVPQRPKSNFVLITFDALSAEDMTLYGRRLPTTPNIDAFARNGTVFTNFYSASTFTTPGMATILTGLYPSESHVYHLPGDVSTRSASSNLPQAMRAAGYATGGFFSNPYAYYLVQGDDPGFDVLPEPVFQPGGLQHLWDATRPLYPDLEFGSRLDEYFDLERVWNTLGRSSGQLPMQFRAVASFEHAREVMAELPDGFFLWVHVMTPHSPYLPDTVDRGRFLPDAERRTYEEVDEALRWRPHYEPDQQSQVDQRRLRYDEFIATADRAFGTFMSDLEKSGKLKDTTVIVSADHGESFEGGVYQHVSPYLTRPVIHIPLIIRTPNQQQGRTVAITADQTSLAPTILDLAGAKKPDSMRGQSLVGWLNRDGQGAGEGLAFCQYLQKNSVFRPIRTGTVGVIDGQYQYVVYLDTKRGVLRPLKEEQIWNLDRSAEKPAKVEALRAALHARFPKLVD